jgi:hypothetical protein
VNDELEKILKEAVAVYFKVLILCENLPGGTWEINGKHSSGRLACDPRSEAETFILQAEVLTDHPRRQSV